MRASPTKNVSRGDEAYATTPDWFWDTALSAQLEVHEVIAEPHDLGTAIREAFSPHMTVDAVHIDVPSREL
jgi:hypothetical protein